MATAKKRLLTGSTDGKPIKVTANATPGTAIHTAVSGTTAGTYDEIWLWVCSTHTVGVTLTVEFGDATAPDHSIVIFLDPKVGLVPVVPGLCLQNAATVKAFADVPNVLNISGFVNAITD